MIEQQIKEALQEVAEQNISDELDLWPALQTVLTDKRSQNLNFSRTAFRVGWVMPILVALFFVVTVAYAVSPAIQSLLKMDSGLEDVSSNGLSHSLNLSQVVNEVTVTLDWAYADENRIAIAYTIHSENGEQYEPLDFTVTDSAGNEFPPTTGLGVTGTSDMLGTILPSGEGAYIFSFDSSTIIHAPETLELQLELTLKSQVTERLVGPVIFNFDIPFTPGRMTEPKQSYTAEGVTITLEKVALTPSDLTAVICFEGPNESYNMWLPISHIDVANNENQARAMLGSQSNPDEAGCTTNHYFPSLYTHNGTWSLTVTELVGIDRGYTETGEPRLDQLRINGTWVFEFALP